MNANLNGCPWSRANILDRTALRIGLLPALHVNTTPDSVLGFLGFPQQAWHSCNPSHHLSTKVCLPFIFSLLLSPEFLFRILRLHKFLLNVSLSLKLQMFNTELLTCLQTQLCLPFGHCLQQWCHPFFFFLQNSRQESGLTLLPSFPTSRSRMVLASLSA